MIDGQMIAILEELRDNYKNCSNSIDVGYYDALNMAITFLTKAVDNSIALEKYQKECFEAKAALKTVEENYSNMVDSWRQKCSECDVLWKVIEVIANGKSVDA